MTFATSVSVTGMTFALQVGDTKLHVSSAIKRDDNETWTTYIHILAYVDHETRDLKQAREGAMCEKKESADRIG